MTESDIEREWKRCKMCLNDPEKRVSEAERFGDLNGPEDYAGVLRHALEEHIDSDELSEVMSGMTIPTPCGDCGEPFVSEVHISDGLRVRSYCDECAETDPVLALMFRRVSVDEILPEITERNSRYVDTDTDRSEEAGRDD
jgi:hypothetical protein